MQKEKDSIKYQLINHKTKFLHRDTIETSIVPLTDWYLRARRREEIVPVTRLMEIQEKVKTVLENAHN